jgi:calcineurin-like phosphoesterase family protein
MSETCEKCGFPWKAHEFAVPAPYCPRNAEEAEFNIKNFKTIPEMLASYKKVKAKWTKTDAAPKDKKWFTSDNHWYHERIIGYCARPFKDHQEMNNVMVEKWNKVVGKDDTVYVLGDWIFADNPQKMVGISKRLNGNKILILGNHDHFNPFHYVEFGGFMSVHTYLKVTLSNGEEINLVHDPAIATIQTMKERWLVGHVHNVFKDADEGRVINVGVDVRGFTPMEDTEIINYKV